MKNDDSPESDNNQLNITRPFPGIVPMYAINPSPRVRTRTGSGRPRLSMYVKILGACPFSARA